MDDEDLVPARMINELLYCERLMYLEWVQREFRDNAFTIEGRAVHRRVDKESGRLPEPPGDDRPAVARSVWLSSQQLAMTAKIDLVDCDGDEAIPVEYKRGKQPDLREKAYLPERAQLCAQVLLLRAHGYRASRGIIYFAGDRRRVEIAIDDELEQATRDAVKRAKKLVAGGVLPPPLEDSPKCKHCSLVSICLPDELHLLRSLEAEPREQDPSPPRRLLPSRDDRAALYVSTPGTRIGVRKARLVVRELDDEVDEVEVRLPNTSQVCLVGNVQMSSQAVRATLTRGIPIAFFSGGGWLVGTASGFPSNNVELRLAQYGAAQRAPFCLRTARVIVNAKIRNCRTLLRRNAYAPAQTVLFSLKRHARTALEATSLEQLLGIEGSAARAYYSSFSAMLKTGDCGAFDFGTRNRRPPRDPINALLSFAYALLTKEVALAATIVGLDPLLGVYHQPRFGRPALALDLMEEFRSLIADSVVVNAVNTRVVREGDFDISPVGVALRRAARRRFIRAFERRMDQLVTHPVFGYRISYRRVLEVQARLFSRVVLGELESYPTFQTR